MHIRRRALGLVAAALLAVGVTTVATAAPALAATNVAGSVACVSGQNITGVFVNANSGGGGWAQGFVPDTSSNVSWHYTLPNGGSYYLAVGCGGTTQVWGSTNYSNNYSGNANFMLCYDTTGTVPVGKILHRCYT